MTPSSMDITVTEHKETGQYQSDKSQMLFSPFLFRGYSVATKSNSPLY